MSDFYLMSRMTTDEFSTKFKPDLFFRSVDECVAEIHRELKDEIEKTFSPEDRANFFIPNEEQIRDSLVNDSYLTYVMVEGSTDMKIIFHISRIGMKTLEIV